MVLGEIKRLCAGFIRRFRRRSLAKKGVIGRRWAVRERRLVNWRPRSSMRQGAKSKRLEHVAARAKRWRVGCRPMPGSPIALRLEARDSLPPGHIATATGGNIILNA